MYSMPFSKDPLDTVSPATNPALHAPLYGVELADELNKKLKQLQGENNRLIKEKT